MRSFDIDISAERVTEPEPRTPERSGPARRICAFAADAALLSLVIAAHAALALWPDPYPFDSLRAHWGAFAALAALLAVAYSWFFAALGARTPGMAMSGLRLRTLDGLPPGPRLAFLRAILAVPSASLGLFGFLLALFDARGQTLHDKLCRCVLLID
jgi:uncharacterized RDD family membrane protein YckC